MEFTKGQIYNHATVLANTLEDIEKVNMPIKIGYHLNKNITTVIEVAQEIEIERNKIIGTYGILEDDQFKFDEEGAEKANKEIKELFEEKVEIPVEEIELKAIENVEMPASSIMAISFMIKE